MFLLYTNGKFLLEKRPEKDPRAKGMVTLTCGNVESGESPEETLKREVREELGVEVKQFHHLDNFQNLALSCEIFNTDAFLVTEYEGKISNLGNEGEHLWVTPEEADSLLKLSGFRLPLFLANSFIQKTI